MRKISFQLWKVFFKRHTKVLGYFIHPSSGLFSIFSMFIHFQTGDESACSSVTMSAVGSIQLSVSHDVNLNLLTVTIVKAVDLPTKREDDLPNPFMKVSLEVCCHGTSEFESMVLCRSRTLKSQTLIIKPRRITERRPLLLMRIFIFR